MIDKSAIELAVTNIIKAIGEDPSREGLTGTPRRIAEMYSELFSGITRDPKDDLQVGFEEG
ncbi:MAG: GTP cyclohydrolase I, partial [Dehalococcoidia bacterium]